MTLQEFSQINRDRCEATDGFAHPLHSWSISDWFTATMGELGEAANVAKKLNRIRDGARGNDDADLAELWQQLGREIADTFIYLDLLSQAAGFDLETLVQTVFDDKSKKIGYPRRLTARLLAAGTPSEHGGDHLG